MASRRVPGPALPGAVGAAAVLLAIYLLTLAPDVTLWDSGELIAAVHVLGVPHPPGTPLFVLVGRAWTAFLAPLGVAYAANLLSAVATAAACGLLAWRMTVWSGSGVAALAAGVAAGTMSTVWRNATETEVYALALLLAAVTLAAADRAGRDDDPRWTVLVAYLLALAVPLHIFALVAAPGALVLAATDAAGRPRWMRGAALAIVVVAVVGAGTARPIVVALAAAAAAAWIGSSLCHRRLPSSRPRPRELAGMLGAAIVGLSVVAVLLARARFDPFLNEGDPSTLAALADVLARRQYAVAAPWPRQAPLWLQLGNVLEYADWQVALGLAPGPEPAWGRTSATLLFALLGAYGAMVHRRGDRRSWRALTVMLAGATVGVVLYLNLKAGPSFGHGVLPDDALREARERDYFFVFAFWLWGAWAGLGAVAAARAVVGRGARARHERLYGGADALRATVGQGGGARGTRGRGLATGCGLLVAALPVVLNWSAVDRRRGADATLALDAGLALLDATPAGAVLLTAGDLDSYPIWYLQAVHGARPDVTVVVAPMLPAAWYRAELARRHGLSTSAHGLRWEGEAAAVGALADAARRGGRPLAATALLDAAVRSAAAEGWVAAGVVHVQRDGAPGGSLDGATAARSVALVRAQVPGITALSPSADPAARRMRRLLACAPLVAGAAVGAPDPTTPGLLASWCNLP